MLSQALKHEELSFLDTLLLQNNEMNEQMLEQLISSIPKSVEKVDLANNKLGPRSALKMNRLLEPRMYRLKRRKHCLPPAIKRALYGAYQHPA